MAAPTSYTNIADLKKLAHATIMQLQAVGLKSIGDLAEKDISPILKRIAEKVSIREAGRLLDVLVKSGVPFKIHPSHSIASIGVIGKSAVKKLSDMGYARLSDFQGVDYPGVYDSIGYGPGKSLLVAVISAGIKPRFMRPDLNEAGWKKFLDQVVSMGLATWEDVAVTLLAELNPPQVGTAVANAVKPNYPPKQAMKEVFKWLYAQNGRCTVSGKRLFLEADHRLPKEQFLKAGKNVRDADRLENFQLLTKRENVIKRGSHRLGGISFTNAAGVLMYVLLKHRPKNLPAFAHLCRKYGLTMSSIRFQEAWAMAIWLARDGLYEIDDSADQVPSDLEPLEES